MELKILPIIEEQIAVEFTGKVNILSNFNRQYLGHFVFKNGELVVKNGEVQTRKKATTQIIQPHFDSQIRRDVQAYYDQFYNLKLHHFEVENVSAIQTDDERFSAHACGKPYEALNVG